MRYASVTDTGRVRQNNEDCYATFRKGRDGVFIVADGMGGHAVGELASRTAVQYVVDSLPTGLARVRTSREMEELLHSMVERANVKVYLQSLDNRRYKGMGTTLTVAVIRDWRLYLSHIGDCRVYLLHGSSLQRLTVDHTLVQELLDSGSITVEEANNHPKRHMLMRSLGVNEYMSPDTQSFDISEGDLIMLCTDGLYGMVPEQTIRSILRHHKDLDSCLDQLVEAANQAGGKDNITIILVHCNREKTKETL